MSVYVEGIRKATKTYNYEHTATWKSYSTTEPQLL